MSTEANRIAFLEARIAELERSRTRPILTPRLGRRLALLILAAALMLPAGAVLAAHKFSDVPTGHQFHNAITAIADAGITTGCGGNRYCPDGLVTRGQMAAFLSRLGALQPGSAPKVNADRVDGYQGSELLTGNGTIPSGTTVTGVELWTQSIGTDGAFFGFTVPLPARAAVPLDGANVNFGPFDVALDDDPTCTGHSQAPTAPPGRVCIYPYAASGVEDLFGGAAGPIGLRDRAFTVWGNASGTPGGEMQVWATWAYTAP